MKVAKGILKWIFYVLLIPVTYIIVSLILSWITIDRINPGTDSQNSIFLSTNGVHLHIIMPKKAIGDSLLFGLKHKEIDNYLSFGWGEENFYIHTPTWGDLTFSNAFAALFLSSTSLMHVTRYQKKSTNWVEININDSELIKLNRYLLNTFEIDKNNQKVILENQGYTQNDDFYKAKGSYSCFKTCNSWVNSAFKESGLKSCFWTPFDFGLLNKYE